MKSYAQVLFLAIPLAIVPAAFAQHETFTVNPDTSQVAFTLGGSGHHVQGTFHLQSGSIAFDPSAQKISGAVIIAAGSGNSGEPSRDKKMNTDVLDTGHFAEVTFAPSSYQGTIATSGDSTIHSHNGTGRLTWGFGLGKKTAVTGLDVIVSNTGKD